MAGTQVCSDCGSEASVLNPLVNHSYWTGDKHIEVLMCDSCEFEWLMAIEYISDYDDS